MALSKDARNWLESQRGQFMQPAAEYFTEDEALEYCPASDSDEAPSPEDYGAGWYSRLSAPGYMDCTDWQGPYSTEDEALEALYDTFGD